MADKGPFLTCCIIFYLSIGAAVFQMLEEPHWTSARDEYELRKESILRNHPCLTREALEEILEVAAEAAGQGVAITGDAHVHMWDWGNSVIFASTIVTTIGFGNVAPKTEGGRVFCILYGLCGIPLCLVWISELGSFFGGRAKRLSQVLIRKGISVKKVQLTCTVLFLSWGLLVHLVIPPLVFMSLEGWSYLEGLYYSFITLTTVGFGDYVAGVNPNIEYPRLYKVFAELWIYMGLAWLSLFFSWNVNMVVEAHKVLKKKRRRRHRTYYEEEPLPEKEKHSPGEKPTVIDIFDFPKEEDYSTIIREIGAMVRRTMPADNINRSLSCNDILSTNIRTLDHSPRRTINVSEVFVSTKAEAGEGGQNEERSPTQESDREPGCADNEEKEDSCASESEADIITLTVPKDASREEGVQHAGGGETRFTISMVEEDLLMKDEE